MKEVWENIDGYFGRYQCSPCGKIRSVDWRDSRGHLRKGKILKQQKESNGYLQVRFYDAAFLSHRIIAKAFLPKIDGKDFVNHKNGIKTDNRLENLEWVTKSENSKHSFLIGTQCNKGENHPANKLKLQDVITMRESNKNGVSAYQLSKLYNISYTQAKDIVKKRSWKHV